jgi:hypothetical protein
MDYTATPIPEKQDPYAVTKTISKAAPPLVLIILVQVLKGMLSGTNTEVSDDIIYSAALALCSGYLGLVNWIKNRKKGKTAQ